MAGEVYENIQVLGDLSIAEFGRTMTAITAWVAPDEGCLYCHVEGNLASDERYTKIVARRMLQMVQHMNATWGEHVGDTGVTCYTCHRGNPVPRQIWFLPSPPHPQGAQPGSALGHPAGHQRANAQLGGTSGPVNPFAEYFLNKAPIRVSGPAALPGTGQGASIQQAEATYGLMMHMSQALGVNCTFCHHAQSFQSWTLSAPQRVTAWHGIRLVRELNLEYLTADPLIAIFPANRRGPQGDVAKVNCATCHQGAYKPLYGSHLASYYPAVLPSALRPAVPPSPVPEPAPLPPVRPDPRTGRGQP